MNAALDLAIGQVLIRVKANGTCGSDIHYIYHEHKGDTAEGTAYLDVVARHEPCGQIVKRGLGCRHFQEGDRVVVYHISGYGFCRNCRKALRNSLKIRKISIITYNSTRFDTILSVQQGWEHCKRISDIPHQHGSQGLPLAA